MAGHSSKFSTSESLPSPKKVKFELPSVKHQDSEQSFDDGDISSGTKFDALQNYHSEQISDQSSSKNGTYFLVSILLTCYYYCWLCDNYFLLLF